ncbi:MAG TPA: hypothetical protein VKX17_06225 [Planctomycetota bacterium]|nr:hypothetical protein [Planctomycetota bacterium]
MRALTIVLLALVSFSAFSQEAAVFEGRPAQEWAAEIPKIKFEPDGTLGAEMQEKMEHVQIALTELGVESIKPLAAVLRTALAKPLREFVNGLLQELDTTPEARAEFLELLKDEHYAVRMMAIDILLSERHLMDAAIMTAAEAMLKDKDRAVVRAARLGLERIKEMREQHAEAERQLKEQENLKKANDPKEKANAEQF